MFISGFRALTEQQPMREIKNRQGKEEVVNISIPRFIYFFSYAELAGEVLQRGRLDQ